MNELAAMEWLRKAAVEVKGDANVMVPRSYLRRALKALDEAQGPRLRKMHIENGSIEMTIEESTGLVHRMAAALCKMLDDCGAKNYLQKEVSIGTRDYVLLVQRRSGKTPHQLRAEAEAVSAGLLAALVALDPQCITTPECGSCIGCDARAAIRARGVR